MKQIVIYDVVRSMFQRGSFMSVSSEMLTDLGNFRAIDQHWILLYSVSYPMKTHVDRFWTTLFDSVGCKADRASVVA